VDGIQDGEIHGRVSVIECITPSCQQNLSSKVWISFSIVSQLNLYTYTCYLWEGELPSHDPFGAVRGHHYHDDYYYLLIRTQQCEAWIY
jgi:hypothetical protein